MEAAAGTAFAALDLLGIALLAGAGTAWLWLAPGRPPGPVIASDRIGTLFGIALVALLAGSAFDLLSRTAVLADVTLGEAWRHVPRVLTTSDYGAFWIAKAVLILLLCALLAWRDRPTGIVGAGTLLAALLAAAFIAATGHAGEDGPVSLLALSNTLHVTAATIWGGSVLVYVAGVMPRMRAGRVPAWQAADSAERLSTIAGLALAAVLVTGVYNSWMLVGSIPGLTGTEYGITLLVKLAFVAVMIGIGFYNRFFAVPAIRHWSRPPRLSAAADAPVGHFQCILKADVIVFLIIVLAAATLGNITPAVHP